MEDDFSVTEVNRNRPRGELKPSEALKTPIPRAHDWDRSEEQGEQFRGLCSTSSRDVFHT